VSYFERLDDIQDIVNFYNEKYPDPEKWWSEEHTKIRVYEQWGIEHLLEVLLDSNPEVDTEEVIYNCCVDIKRKSLLCKNNKDLYIMYHYAIIAICLLGKYLDSDDLYYTKLIKKYMEEETDYDDEY
jgi:hypothetical protein